MKTLFAIMVLLVSTTSFAGEGRDVGLVADRIELRNEMKKDSQAYDSQKVEHHCDSNESNNTAKEC